MGFTEAISNFFGAIKELFGFASKRSDLRNSSDMKQAKEAKTEAAAVDTTNQAIARNDVQEIRNELSE